MNSRKILTLFPQIFPGLPLFWAHFICKLGCLKLSYSYLMLSSFSFLPLHVHFSRLHIHSIATSSVSLIFPLFFNTYLFPHSVFHHRLLFSSPEVSCDYKSFVFNLFSLSCTLLNIRNTVIIANWMPFFFYYYCMCYFRVTLYWLIFPLITDHILCHFAIQVIIWSVVTQYEHIGWQIFCIHISFMHILYL